METLKGTSSQFGDRETLGTQLINTADEHSKSSPVEVNDLSHECGKAYMKALYESIEKHSNLEDDYFIQVTIDKPREYRDRAVRAVFVVRSTQPDMMPNTDLWGISNRRNSVELLFSLPDWRDMSGLLDNESVHNEKLIGWIKQYAKIQADRKKKHHLIKPIIT